MKYQHHLIKKGSLRRSKLGGYSWDLPAKGADGRPAPLPKEVLAFHHIAEKEEEAVMPDRGDMEDKNRKKDQELGFAVESGSDDGSVTCCERNVRFLQMLEEAFQK